MQGITRFIQGAVGCRHTLVFAFGETDVDQVDAIVRQLAFLHQGNPLIRVARAWPIWRSSTWLLAQEAITASRIFAVRSSPSSSFHSAGGCCSGGSGRCLRAAVPAVLRHLELLGVARYLVAATLEHAVSRCSGIPVRDAGADRGTVSRGGGHAFHFQAQRRLPLSASASLSRLAWASGVSSSLPAAKGTVPRSSLPPAARPAMNLNGACTARRTRLQGLPDDRHDAELRVVQITGHRQLDIDVALGVL